MKIPKDVSGIRKKLAEASNKLKREQSPGELKTRQLGSDAAEARKKYREAKEGLSAKEAEIADLKAENAQLKDSVAALEKELNDTRPNAEKWTKFEHVERQKLLKRLPPEEQREAKDMDIRHLRLFVDKLAPGGGGTDTDSGKKSTDPKAKTMDEVLKLPKDEANAFFDAVNEGKAKIIEPAAA